MWIQAIVRAAHGRGGQIALTSGIAYTKLPSELSPPVDEVEWSVEVLVRKRRVVVLRRVRWMWIVVCGFAGSGRESWRGLRVGAVPLSVGLVAMVGAVVRAVVCDLVGPWYGIGSFGGCAWCRGVDG